MRVLRKVTHDWSLYLRPSITAYPESCNQNSGGWQVPCISNGCNVPVTWITISDLPRRAATSKSTGEVRFTLTISVIRLITINSLKNSSKKGCKIKHTQLTTPSLRSILIVVIRWGLPGCCLIPIWVLLADSGKKRTTQRNVNNKETKSYENMWEELEIGTRFGIEDWWRI